MTELWESERSRQIRTLYIDDDQQLLELAREFLESRHSRIDVETVQRPRKGLSLLDTGSFDVVVCDYQMPEMDGLELLETLREERGDAVPFIVFTGKGREEVAIEALNLGADRYVRKGGDPTSQYGVLAQAIEQAAAHSRTRRKLRKRERNLQRVLDSIGDAVITTDVDGTITRMNAVAEELTGWDAADALGEPLSTAFEILNHETREPETSPAETVLETGKIVGLANGTILVRKDGTERFIADSASPIESEDGDVLGVVIVFRDVTEKYRERQRRTDQRRTIIDLSTDTDLTFGNLESGARAITEAAAETLGVERVGIWSFEVDNTVLRSVDLYEASTGTHDSGAELTVETHSAYFEALETSRVVAADDAQADSRTRELREDYLEPLGITSMLDATVRSGDEVVGVVCHEHTGDPREWTEDERRFAGELADQTRRLLANHEQRTYEQALEALHSIATEIPTDDDPTAVCERTVAAAETILDFEQCVINLEDDGMLPIVATSKELPPDGVTPMSVDEGIAGKTVRTGDSFLFDDVREVDDANPQGPYRAALSVPIGDHGVFQAVDGRVGVFEEDDVELAELLVSHATRALDQLANESELRQRNERLDEFASIVSHDLRNPLNVAQGRLELAKQECDSPHLDDVVRAHDRMARLIDDLLAIAREGDRAAETGPLDLAETVEDCWRNVQTGRANLVARTDAVIEADGNLLRQLLENLYRNAVEHGGRDVTVRIGDLDGVSASNARGDSTDESVGGFYVEDDGPGIDRARRADVFEMGYSTADEGTGLGLSIVKRTAEAHGWEVGVVEGEDGGARFEVTGVTVLES